VSDEEGGRRAAVKTTFLQNAIAASKTLEQEIINGAEHIGQEIVDKFNELKAKLENALGEHTAAVAASTPPLEPIPPAAEAAAADTTKTA